MNRLRLIVFFFAVLIAKPNFAAHLMGGEITWQALGGDNYQFTLVIYRDCNGLDIIAPTQDVRVWRHPSVTSITCNLISSEDLSPACTTVPGSPPEIDCGAGAGGGTGPGAVQKFIYQSGTVTLAGTPPAEGWAFTYDSFSRNWDLDNISNPFEFGFTLSSLMYAVPDECLDSSPSFAQNPYILLCAGSDFQFDSNAFDEDNDSLAFSWGIPLDHFPSGDFNPPTNPVPVPFNTGYSAINPTPDATFDPGNEPAEMDPQTGEITFVSNTPGNFGFVQKIDSYRDGVLISTVNRESQLIVIPCDGYVNTPPTILPPFDAGTSFDAEFFAGELINFDIVVQDVEFLQDGTPQTVTLIPTGNYFGNNLTDPDAGCDYGPCATLDTPPLIQGVQGVTTTFNWQTSCDHLLDACGIQQDEQIYTFVLNAKDDYCSVPGRSYQTIRIKLKNIELVEPVELHCADVLDDGSVNLSWTPTTDPSGSFVNYEVRSVEDGLIATIADITEDNFLVAGAGADAVSKRYFIQTRYGCGGGSLASSDTLASVFMDLDDLGDGRVLLKWNELHTPKLPTESATQQIYREYPLGTWTLRGEVDYGTNLFVDTIDICLDFMNYEVRIDNDAGCTSTSNKEGKLLEDKINPAIPILDVVSVNPISEFVDIRWNVNPAPDTYGYVIYKLDTDIAIWLPLDTVYGRFTTEYTNTLTEAIVEAESYRVTAFDSCLTTDVPPSYQTSALSPGHTTVFLEKEYDLCNRTMQLSWTPYLGWDEPVDRYEVLTSIGGSPYEVIATIESADLTFEHTNLIYDVNYCYYIRAVSASDSISNSNKSCGEAVRPSQPAFHYLAAASHNLSDNVDLTCYTDGSAAVQFYEVQVKDPYASEFETIAEVEPITGTFFNFTHSEVYAERGAYQYRINLIDTCGSVGIASNIARTAFVEVQTDNVQMLNTLSWSAYAGFDANITEYRIYRGENGLFETTPIATTLPGVRSFVDDVSEFYNSQGQFCYRVEAVEGLNSYGFSETAFSNTTCATITPLVYIPNAFMINGLNNRFLPVISLYDFDSYNLIIYDRWGGVVFQTADRNEGWDGFNQRDGKPYQEGTYVYQLRFTDREDKAFDYTGTVTLLIAE